jgi:leader peptidase (prepilin peptidase)/N-methyltransferase
MNLLDPQPYQALPFHFWTAVLFVFGSMVGSFLNVCIHRMPRGESIVSPPSHCPHCNYSIPWYLNLPLITWLFLRGKCANCRAPISVRYFLVELLTGILFAAVWIKSGHQSAGAALSLCVLVAGLVAATFIDFEHFIIPDEITFGGMGAGLVLSVLAPKLHGSDGIWEALQRSAMGMAVGAAVIYGIVRIGKLLFGKQKIEFDGETEIHFTETTLKLPDGEIPYEELFYRKSDAITFEAVTIRFAEKTFSNVPVRMTRDQLTVGTEILNPEAVAEMHATTSRIVLPREAMGFGDVKFMAAIGAFLGWRSIIFILMVSSLLGSAVGITAIVFGKREWSSRLPFGPYIAAAALVWILGGSDFVSFWMNHGYLPFELFSK